MNIFSEHSSFFRNLFLIVFGLIFYVWITNPMTVTVTGYGDADVPANSAIISLTVTDIDVSATQAQANLERKVQEIKKAMIEGGVDPAKLVQSQIQILPASTVSPGASGFAATATLGGPTGNIQNIGALTSTLYERGASLVAQPVLRNENMESLESDAMKMALKDAEEQASNIGTQNWRFFKRVGAVVQAETPTTGTFTTETQDDAEAGLGKIITPNSFKISKAVQVTYLIW